MNGANVKVKGPKGTLEREFTSYVVIKKEDDKIIVTPTSEEKKVRALHGTTRAVINNMVVGVSEGFQRILEIEGVGLQS